MAELCPSTSNSCCGRVNVRVCVMSVKFGGNECTCMKQMVCSNEKFSLVSLARIFGGSFLDSDARSHCIEVCGCCFGGGSSAWW